MRQSADSTLLERLREAQRIGKEIRTFTEGLGQREIPETENSSQARPSSEVRFTSRCPLCKHPARDHKLGMRGETMHRNRISGPHYCHHAQRSGEFCQCSVPAEYFLGSGTQLLIRPDALAVGQWPKLGQSPKLRPDVVIDIKTVELEAWLNKDVLTYLAEWESNPRPSKLPLKIVVVDKLFNPNDLSSRTRTRPPRRCIATWAWTKTETHILLDREHLRRLTDSDKLWMLENDMKESILHELAHIIVDERFPKSNHNVRWQAIFSLLCTHFGVEMTSIRRVEPA